MMRGMPRFRGATGGRTVLDTMTKLLRRVKRHRRTVQLSSPAGFGLTAVPA